MTWRRLSRSRLIASTIGRNVNGRFGAVLGDHSLPESVVLACPVRGDPGGKFSA